MRSIRNGFGAFDAIQWQGNGIAMAIIRWRSGDRIVCDGRADEPVGCPSSKSLAMTKNNRKESSIAERSASGS